MQVGKQLTRNIFYYVVHSERSLRDDPVVLWLTGGPGCSGMDAFVFEHGPFMFNFSGRYAHRLTAQGEPTPKGSPPPPTRPSSWMSMLTRAS